MKEQAGPAWRCRAIWWVISSPLKTTLKGVPRWRKARAAASSKGTGWHRTLGTTRAGSWARPKAWKRVLGNIPASSGMCAGAHVTTHSGVGCRTRNSMWSSRRPRAEITASGAAAGGAGAGYGA